MRSIILGVMVFMTISCFSQKDSTKVKKANHYLGVQANQLLRQLFNLSGNTTIVSNPYLLNYSVNSVKSGWGLNVGIGYTVDQSTQSDANTTNDSQINNFSSRIGAERKVFVAKKWMVSYGLDLLSDKSNTSDKVTSQFSGTTSETDISTTTKDSGFGPRFTLNYFITPKIILGTELTYYYKAISISQDTSNSVSGGGGSSSSHTDQKLKQFHFNAPALLLITMKF